MILVILPVIICKIDGLAQPGNSLSPYRKFPIVTGVQFQNFAMPFRDMGSNFTHPGIYLGSEIYYNEKGSLFQQAVLGGYLNRETPLVCDRMDPVLVPRVGDRFTPCQSQHTGFAMTKKQKYVIGRLAWPVGGLRSCPPLMCDRMELVLVS